jgi:peptidoglycan L-alanyl-D-glutamate endopeptidase CwlK
MKDQKTIERIKLLHPKLRDEAAQIYDEICAALTGRAMCRFGFTLRTFAEQNEIYAQGRTKPGHIVTKAKGGLSMHNYGLAIDIVLIIDGKTASWDVKGDFDGDGKSDWMEVVTIFKQYGWEWGGDWKFYDAPHFQKTFGYSVRQLLALHEAGKVDDHGFVKI